MSEAKDLPISWEEFHRHSKVLAWRLLELQTEWKGIIAITRGGLVPAAIVARELEVRLIDTLCVASYDHKDQGEANILKQAEIAGDGEGWLIIDDLADTGKTAIIARELMPKAHIAVVYAKPQGLPTVDSFIMEVSQDTWIHFPWDVELKFAQPLANKKKAV
ncbi:MAG: xanthine phosphoribosyltransferase [Micavibrio sp.]|nr:MAG: xanthine phosphoribosyltransferase [Micavibrio sp.]